MLKRFFEAGGVIAGVILIAFGIGAMFIGVTGRSEVRDNLKQEAIVGSADMTPALIQEEAAKAGLQDVTLPTCSVAGKTIDTGSEAKCFASYMRIHALESTGGLSYAQMGRFMAKPGTPAKLTDGHGATSDERYALVDSESGRTVENGLRNLWVTETALATALNTAFFAEQVALFGIVVGVALLLAGIGFLVLAYLGALRKREVPVEADEAKGFKRPVPAA
jgi:hypothetical protein